MDTVIIHKIDESYVHVECDDGIARELHEYFTFYVPGYKFMPQYRNGLWDGKIKLFNLRNKTIYAGLANKIELFCSERCYEFTNDNDLLPALERDPQEIIEWVAKLGLQDYKGDPLIPHKEQFEALFYNLTHKRSITIIPTGGGKSLVAFLLAMYYLTFHTFETNQKVLLIVPTTTLVEQMYKDFDSYSPNISSDDICHRIYSGKDKETSKPIIITTWQSIFRLHKPWFSQFGMVIGDEVHGFKAKSLSGIMEKATNAKFRTGLTGTLDGSLTSEMTLEGLFGNIKKFVTTKDLMDRGVLSDLHITSVLLNYSDEEKKLVSKLDYQNEMTFLEVNAKRNEFIRDLATSLDGNTIITFKKISHGEELYKIIKDHLKDTGRNVYYVSGKVKTDDREFIRNILEKQKYKKTVVFEFGNSIVRVRDHVEVRLASGQFKKAIDVNSEDDVCDKWIEENRLPI